jgi:hypothetical protein
VVTEIWKSPWSRTVRRHPPRPRRQRRALGPDQYSHWNVTGSQNRATPNPTGTVTGSPQPSGTPGVTQTPVTNCTGANPHPTGQKLAQRFGVSYDEIMGWFCQHFGFGEIDLAYDLSRQSDPWQPSSTCKSGLGWAKSKTGLGTANRYAEDRNRDSGLTHQGPDWDSGLTTGTRLRRLPACSSRTLADTGSRALYRRQSPPDQATLSDGLVS